jgi:tRNA A-37 threonylcarbamoyl transferase component Bud32
MMAVAPMSRRLQLRWNHHTQDIDAFAVTVGRDPAAEVQLDDPQVAARHATITRAAGEFFVEVLPTQFDSALNGARLYAGAWQRLQTGDRLQLGGLVLEVVVDGEAAAGCGLIILNGSQRGTGFPLRARAQVGGPPTCELRLLDEQAGSAWLDVVPQAGVWTVRPGSGAGLRLNDAVLDGARLLAHGDQLAIGEVRLLFIEHGRRPQVVMSAQLPPTMVPRSARSAEPSSPSLPAAPSVPQLPEAPPAPPPAPLLGRTINGYRFNRVIGRGGMGIVYEAERESTREPVAVKVLAEKYALDTELVERFFREALLAGEVEHEGITQMFDCATTQEGTPFLVMELLRGESLANRLSRAGRLAEPDVRRLGAELAEIVAAVHAAGIVHRDLKPENIHLSPGGPDGERVKLLDLGIAKALRMEELTRTGEVIGTAAYLAPEQCLDSRSVGPRADIYALGCILFEMATGRPPFVGGVLDLMQQHVSSQPPRPQLLAPISDALEAVILKCLRKRPDARMPGMRELRRELVG